MSIFFLKLLALLAMIIDHIAEVFGFEDGGWDFLSINSTALRYIGRMAFPIFAFCIVEGWAHTHNQRKYFSRLILCATISQIPFTLALYIANFSAINNGETDYLFRFMPIFIPISLLCAFSYWWVSLDKNFDISLIILTIACLLPAFLIKVKYIWLLSDNLNVLYTLALGIAILSFFEKIRYKNLHIWEYVLLAATIILAIAAYGTNADYGIGLMGLVLIVALYFVQKNRALQAATIFIWGSIYYGVVFGNWGNAVATAFPAILIFLYDGRKGPSNKLSKYLFYVFYPLHLLIIGAINVVVRLFVF